MNPKSMRFVFFSLVIFVLATHFRSVVSQSDGHPDWGYENDDPMRMLRKMLGGLMTIGQEATSRISSGPGVYDMVKNDSELGINVMSGLVKVDRVREPGRPRALSVRVFGIPVFNKGFNQGDVMPTDRRSGPRDEVDVVPGARGGIGGGSNNDGSRGEEEDLPLD